MRTRPVGGAYVEIVSGEALSAFSAAMADQIRQTILSLCVSGQTSSGSSLTLDPAITSLVQRVQQQRDEEFLASDSRAMALLKQRGESGSK